MDVESTTFQKGNPFSERNRLCAVGLGSRTYRIEHGGAPYGNALADIQKRINDAVGLIGFNLKFDLHWLKRYGLDFSHCAVWDCQLVEFIHGAQSESYPSLDGCCERYNLGRKSTWINDNYWSKGIDTTEVPWSELDEYLHQDLDLTRKLYNFQCNRGVTPLIRLHNQDLLVLQAMEYNGTKVNWQRMEEMKHEQEIRLKRIDESLKTYTGGFEQFNPASEDHVSALLYGGKITVKTGTPYQHTYKGGAKQGQVAERYKWSIIQKSYPRLVEPLAGSALKKEGLWSTDDKTLRSLKATKAVKELLRLLQDRADASKLLDTYLVGFPTLRDAYDWQDGLLHGQLNQCVVVSGRLSSAKPNMQNMDGRMDELITSRFSTVT